MSTRGSLGSRLPAPLHLVPVWVAGVIFGVMSWPVGTLSASTGLDPSYIAAQHLAIIRGLDFGRDIVFVSMGPLGFLTVPRLFSTWTAALAFLFSGTIHFALCLFITAYAWRIFGGWAALTVAFVLTRTLPSLGTPEAFALLAFLVCFEILRRHSPGRDYRAAVVAAALIGAVAMLTKLSIGIIVPALFVVTAFAVDRSRWKLVSLFVGVMVPAVVVLWVVSGQSLASMDDFARHSADAVSGFPTAMNIEEGGREWEYLAAALAIPVVFLAGRSGTTAWDRRYARALLVLGAIIGYPMFKQGFVRHGVGHSIALFVVAVVIAVAFGSLIPDKKATLMTIAVLLVAVWGSSRLTPPQFLDPYPSARALAVQSRALVLPSKREEWVDGDRATMRATYGLDDATLELLSGQTVHVDSWETGVVWAYPELDWKPVPVFQPYAAYTEGLDGMNADFLASDDAPARILRSVPLSLDSRNPNFEQPETKLEMLCRYVELNVTDAWEVLGRVPDRCGEPELISSSTAGLGATVTVPAEARPDRIVYVRVAGLGDSLLDHLQTFVFKSDEYYMTVNGATRFRIVPGNAAGPLLMKVPDVANSTGPFGVPETTSLFIAADANSIWPPGSSRLEFSFYSLPVGPAESLTSARDRYAWWGPDHVPVSSTIP